MKTLITPSYEFTGLERVNDLGHTVKQIRAIRDVPSANVHAGDVGGWIESAELPNGNARLSGDAWVSGTAQVFGTAQVSGNARVFGDAQVSGNARVYGNARVSGNAQVYGTARVYATAQVSGNARVEQTSHYLVVGPIGSEGVAATLFRTKNGKHALVVGCWTGTLGKLSAEVKRRRVTWYVKDSVQEVWVEQYKALKALG